MVPPLSVQDIIRTRKTRLSKSTSMATSRPRAAPTDDEDGTDDAVATIAADMHKSLMSMITATRQPRSFQTRFDDVSSEDEAEDPPTNLATSMVDSQILPPTLDAASEPKAPFLSMTLKGEADMGASQEPDLPEPESQEPSPVSLAQRLKDIFDLEELEEVTAEYPCWLLHSVLLPGYLYITTKHVCYYAFCPKQNNKLVKSGWLRKRGRHNPSYTNYYMELKGDVLRYYNQKTDIYEPRGHIDLRFAISATIEPDPKSNQSSNFKIVLQDRQILFKAENYQVANDWINSLQKIIFRAHNSGDSVKICIPTTNIIDAEEERILNVTDTVKLRVIENFESYSLDEYFFSFFDVGLDAIKTFQKLAELNIKEHNLEEFVEDSSNIPGSTSKRSFEAVRNTISHFDYDEKSSRRSSHTSLNALKLKTARSKSRSRRSSPIDNKKREASPNVTSDSLILNRTDVFRTATGHGVITDSEESDISEPPTTKSVNPGIQVNSASVTASPSSSTLTGAIQNSALTGMVKTGANQLVKVGSVAKYITGQSRRMTSESIGKLSGLWHGQYKHYGSWSGEDRDDIIIPGEDVEAYAQRYRSHFGLPDAESLVATYYTYMVRILYTYGKLYIGKHFVCYRSFAGRTKCVFPMDAIESVKKVQHNFLKDATTRGYEMYIAAKGHEPLFFSFASVDARDDCIGIILKAIDNYENIRAQDRATAQGVISEYNDLVAAGAARDIEWKMAKRLFETTSNEDNIPPVYFDDPITSIVSTKPPKTMKITLLTIGSRGDVQPFIALGKGLIAEGHTVKLATHAEFENWIRSHGLDFSPVSGDPGELMKICIEYGMFTIGFLYEAHYRFGGWIDDLLLTAWKACQGADMIIESPSAMAGIHIAEALKIPYFRAFTMPWTRTRAYPHAFTVTDVRRGGAFNSLSYVLIDQLFWKGTAGNINRWRKKTLNLPATSLDQMQPNKVPFLYNYSQAVVPPPLDYPEWVRITGYWFLDEANSNWKPPIELVNFMSKAKKDGKKLVYIGFGSILVENPAALTKTVVDAVIKADVRCILAKGWSERQTKTTSTVPTTNPAIEPIRSSVDDDELPDEIFAIKTIPHDWLFPKMDAVVHHAGSGTTGASLRAGVPTVVKPFFGDQYFFARRIEDLGVGIALPRLNASNFWKALRTATTDERMIEAARKLGERIREEDGVKVAIGTIYQDLDYASGLIKKRPGEGHDGELSGDNNIEDHWTIVDNDFE